MSRLMHHRLLKIEATRTGTGLAFVEYQDGEYRHNGSPITQSELDQLDRDHAHVIIRGDAPHQKGMVTIRRSYGK